MQIQKPEPITKPAQRKASVERKSSIDNKAAKTNNANITKVVLGKNLAVRPASSNLVAR
jgi:hypothetical protein